MATSEETQGERALKAISQARNHQIRGDIRPASTYGQMRIVISLVAVAESQMAIAEELRQLRELLQRGGDTPIAVQAYTS